MRRWKTSQAEGEVKQAITRAGRGGGFILADDYGEIPFQTLDEVLLAISETAHTWGQYPLSWIEKDGKLDG